MSSFERMVIPPPMSAHTISLKSPVNQVSFDVGPNKHNMLTKCSQSLAYLKYDQSALSYQSCDVLMGDSSEVLGQIVLLNGNFVASLRCNEDETQLVLFEFHHNTLRMEKRSFYPIFWLKFLEIFDLLIYYPSSYLQYLIFFLKLTDSPLSQVSIRRFSVLLCFSSFKIILILLLYYNCFNSLLKIKFESRSKSKEDFQKRGRRGKLSTVLEVQ